MKVGIIGAGLTGLFIAKALRLSGHEVVVFEKSRGRGGRLANKRLSWGSFDIGAQYFTVRSSSFQTIVDGWQEQGVVSPWTFTPYKKIGDQIVPSPDSTTRYVGMPTMNAIAHQLSDNVKIEFQQRVDAIGRRNEQWLLNLSESNTSVAVDKLVITTPLEQTLPLLETSSISYDDLPNTIHLPCWAFGFKTSTRLVNHNIKGIFGDDVISWVSRECGKPNRAHRKEYSQWMVHFSPQWSRKHLPENTTSTVDRSNLPDFSKHLAEIASDWLAPCFEKPPKIDESFHHFWRYANIEQERHHIDNYKTLRDDLAVAGAWCAGGKVEGAFVSAESLLASGFFGSDISVRLS